MRSPLKYGFFGLEYEVDYNDYTLDAKKHKHLHYDPNKRLWVHEAEYTGNVFPALYPCHSLKAAKHHLKKHSEIPKGTKFRLVSIFVGGDIYLYKK